jgi:hypothetical protein
LPAAYLLRNIAPQNLDEPIGLIRGLLALPVRWEREIGVSEFEERAGVEVLPCLYEFESSVVYVNLPVKK